MEIAAQVVGPKTFPEPQRICPIELTLVPDKQHAKEEEEICGVCRLEVHVEFGVHELNEMI